MTIEYPTIADIQTTELVYFDQDQVDECYEFCELRDIDCLPDVSDTSVFYRRDKEAGKFVKEEITEARRIEIATYIFTSDLLVRFKHNPVQFVFEGDNLTGVVHFSDYNKDIVSIHLYMQILHYERNLRALLELNNLKNEDMYKRFKEILDKTKKPDTRNKYEGKLNRYTQNQDKFSKWPQFMAFELWDLIDLAKNKNVILLNFKVNELRNAVMHNHEHINMVDHNSPDYIYEFEPFNKFFDNATLLIYDVQRIRNQLQKRKEPAAKVSGAQFNTQK